jgi:drug/metabolite transporter (DMT)-like permease
LALSAIWGGSFILPRVASPVLGPLWLIEIRVRLAGPPPLLSLVATAFAYVLFFRLVVDVGPTRALTVTFLNPIFGIVWGAVFLVEHITASALVGCAVILLGTALVVGVRLPAPWARVAAEAATGD